MTKFLIMNNFKELSRQFFKMMPLSLLVDFVLKDQLLLNFEYSYSINVVYKLVYKFNHKLDDVDLLEKLYVSFKMYILALGDEESGSSCALRKKQKFLLMLTQNKYQYIMIRYLKKLKKMITIDKSLFLSIIANRMYLFIAEFANHQQFEHLIQINEIFNKLLIDNSNSDLIIL